MTNERCSMMVGRRRGRIWQARLWGGTAGSPCSVELDWARALEREERRADLLGFYHTHPAGSTAPSERDLRTMRAWVSCLGKPLLCVIESPGALMGYLFENDADPGAPLAEVQRFPRGLIIAVTAGGAPPMAGGEDA